MPTGFRARAVRVRVPATSANLGPGFDALGLALGRYDEVEARVVPAGLSVAVAGEGADTVPRTEQHLVVRAMRAGFAVLGEQPPGLALRCVNRIPQARGLGSSAAAIAAGVLAARALVDDAASGVRDLPVAVDLMAALALAADLEGHPDNVAACLLGGLTVAWTEGKRARAVRLEPAELGVVVFVPPFAASTDQARRLLPASVPHRDAASNAARSALLVAALTGRPDLLLPATEDRLHQPYRAPAMPQTADLVGRLRAAGVPAVVSGAGPSVLAFVRSGENLRAFADPDWRVDQLAVDRAGATISLAEQASW